MLTAGEPGWRRVMRLLAGAVLTAVFVPTFVRLAGIVVLAWRDGSGADVHGVAAGLLLPIGVLATYGLSLALHAVRGTRPAHPLRPFLIAIPFVLGMTVYRAGGLAPVIDGRQGTAPVILLSIAVIGVAVTVHVLVHELGHVAAAHAVGSRFQALRLGPVLVRRDGDRLRLERNRLRMSGVLGSALSIPTSAEGFARSFALTILGGPAATIAATLLLWVGARAVSPPDSDGEVVLSFVLWHATFVGAFLAVVNLAPLRFRSGVRTDGANAWLALTARTTAAREALRYMLNAWQGRRPREWGTTAEALEAAADADPRYPEVRLAALGVALDTGDMARAAAILSRGCGSTRREEAFRQEFALQESLLASLIHGDAAAARARLAEVGVTPLRDYALLAEAAAALAEERRAYARTLLARWRDAVARSGHPGSHVGNEWAEELLAERLAASEARRPGVVTISAQPR